MGGRPVAGTDEDVRGDALAALHVALEHEGVKGALRFLNQRTRHRYTGIYRFDPPMLRSVAVYDRENPALQVGGDSRIEQSYCSLVRDDERLVAIADAGEDPRAVDHPARQRYQAYCGTPVRDGDGRCIGSLCHFDTRPRLVPESELPLLERAAALLGPYCVTA
jgi:GAF domain-containing protein